MRYVLLAIVVLVGGFAALGAVVGPQKPEQIVQDLSPATQKRREALVQEYVNRGVFERVHIKEGVMPTAWVGPGFSRMKYDDKLKAVSLVAAYSVGVLKGGDGSVALRDTQSGRVVGEFSPATSLQMR